MVSLVRCIRSHRRTAPVRFVVKGEVYHSAIPYISLLSCTTYFFVEFSLVDMIVSVACVTMELNHKKPPLKLIEAGDLNSARREGT
jgi:hypothetical protein